MMLAKYALAAFGGFLWTALWCERSIFLGIFQGVLIVLGLAHEFGVKK